MFRLRPFLLSIAIGFVASLSASSAFAMDLKVTANAAALEGGSIKSFTCRLTGGFNINTLTGLMTATCEESSAVIIAALGGDATVPVDPPVDSPVDPPVDQPLPTDGSAGVLQATGEVVALADDKYGIGTLCVPNCDTPEMIIFDGSTRENYIPGCINELTKTLAAKDVCRSSASFQPNVRYAQRLPVGSRLPYPYAQFITTDTFDELHMYNVSVSEAPGEMTVSNAMCYGSNLSKDRNVYLAMDSAPKSYTCNLKSNSLYYANVQAAGVNAKNCGTSVECHMRLVAW